MTQLAPRTIVIVAMAPWGSMLFRFREGGASSADAERREKRRWMRRRRTHLRSRSYSFRKRTELTIASKSSRTSDGEDSFQN